MHKSKTHGSKSFLNLSTVAFAATAIFFAIAPSSAFAEETAVEKAEVLKNKSVNAVKKGYRKVKDETCELVNGTMKCIPRKVKSKADGLVDDAEAKTSELKNKVD